MSGRAAQSVLEIRASDGAEWTSTPNRRVLPTRWDLTVEADLLFRFDAKVAGKMFNPLYRTSIAAYDCNGVELFAVVDLTSYGDAPVMPAPAALALVAVHQELTDASVD